MLSFVCRTSLFCSSLKNSCHLQCPEEAPLAEIQPHACTGISLLEISSQQGASQWHFSSLYRHVIPGSWPLGWKALVLKNSSLALWFAEMGPIWHLFQTFQFEGQIWNFKLKFKVISSIAKSTCIRLLGVSCFDFGSYELSLTVSWYQ